jgi:hypothetical protein
MQELQSAGVRTFINQAISASVSFPLVLFLEFTLNLPWAQTRRKNIPWREKCQNLFSPAREISVTAPQPVSIGNDRSYFIICAIQKIP